jgi:SHS2 domain-containing protein
MYRWVEHTSELELEIEAAIEADVFRDALAAFRELVADGEGPEEARRHVQVTGEDRAALLVAWLGELAFLAEAQSFVPEQAEALGLGDHQLSASLRGHLGDPRHLVKAVTLHRLLFERHGSSWRARVVLDV